MMLMASPLAAQTLPIVPESCRSEHDARLGFGLCPDSTFDFYATGQYDGAVPRPDSVFGYPIGSWHTTYGRMEQYLDALAGAAPSRVRVIDYGRSVERRTMHLVAVSSEGTIARLEAVRQGLTRLADPRATSTADADGIIGTLPVVVWLNAANDGNETAAFEAVIQIAYQLAAGNDARTRLLRDSVLVLINLAHNPESHERMVAWYNAFVMGDADPAALEHSAPWGMNTNNNHYQFDLNRDGLGLTQTESRAVAAEMQRWRPQVFVDLHGQTTQFFFPPAAIPVNPIYPDQMNEWLDVFGRGNATAFDTFGWSYFTRDVYDLYYPGYWDTYPALHGATGMTFETDGGGGKGVRWRRDDGTVLTFADGIAHHFVASLATAETAARNRTARLRAYYDYFASALADAGNAPMRSVIILPGNRPARADRLAATLLRHGIEVHRVTAAGTVQGTRYGSGTQGGVEVPVGSYAIDVTQPNARLATTLLTPHVELPDDFANQELARRARNARRAPSEQERHPFYDVTAWNLILAGGLDGVWTAQALSLTTDPVTAPADLAKHPGGWASETPRDRMGGAGERARSAYVWRPGDLHAWRLAARLMGEGFHVAWSGRPLVVDGADFPRGSFVVRVVRNPEGLHERIDALARDAGVRVTASHTAYPDRGPTGTGSNPVVSIRPPRIAVAAGEGVGITSYAALWFELEHRVGYPFTALRASDMAGGGLDHFDVIVLPDGGYGNSLGERGANQLKEWVERGGTLIAYRGGARFVLSNGFETSHEEADTTRPPADTIDAILARIDSAAPANTDVPPSVSPNARPDAPMPANGTMLRTLIDPTHWLSVGFESDELVLLTRSLPLPLTTGGVNPLVFSEGNRLVVSGHRWPDNTARTYANRAAVTVDEVGDGQVILFSEDPLYRGVFDAPGGILMNAIFLGARGRPDADER
jgi:hypothetical protein